jgi:hypothetical protein
VQFRQEVRGEFAAVRGEMRALRAVRILPAFFFTRRVATVTLSAAADILQEEA